MSVALVSLFPLEATGGGELYTVETAQSLVAAGERAILIAPVDVPATRTDLASRLRTPFVCTDPAADASPEVIEWADVLLRLADHDHIWVHQYLASDFVFDVIASVASDQRTKRVGMPSRSNPSRRSGRSDSAMTRSSIGYSRASCRNGSRKSSRYSMFAAVPVQPRMRGEG